MTQYNHHRNSYRSSGNASRQRVHQTTMILDRDTVAYLRNHSRKNADFNRRLAALDRLYNDDSLTESQRLNQFRITAEDYSPSRARRSSQSSSRRVSTNSSHSNRRASGTSVQRESARSRSIQAAPARRTNDGSHAASSTRSRKTQAHTSNHRPQSERSRSAASNAHAKANTRGNAQHPQNRKKKRKKRPSKAAVIILLIAAVLLALIVFLGINVVITKNHASSLKNNLEKVLECAKEKDADGAEKALNKSYEAKDKLTADLHSSFWTTASKINRVKEELSAGEELLDVVETAQDDLLTPLVALMKEQPLTELKVGEDGFNVTLINAYLDFVEEIQPELEDLMEKIMAVNTDSMMGGYVAKYKEKLYEYTDAYNEASSMLPLLRVFLGNGEDRLYLFVAQNSAEIRASGGFPGSIGTIRIQDGVLTIGDFMSVYDVLADTISYRSQVTDSEFNVFGSWINAPRDACFIPAFDRTAEIWAVAYEDLQRENGAIDTYEGYVKANTYYDEWSEEYIFEGMSEEEYNEYNVYEDAQFMEYVDGVVSLTPAIIQMLLEDIGEITLSDGSIIDATNATKMLQYDLYHKYFNVDTIEWTSNRTADALFAETAKMVMKEFVSNFEISKFADYYSLFQKGKDKNIIQIWMNDQEEEEIIKESGFSGKLNFDPEDPFTGIYFSLADPSKLGWYIDIIPEISEPEINFDNSRTYDVTVTLRNIMTEEEADKSTEYIIGGYKGSIRGYIHCFAPAGGYITDVETSNWMYMFEASYNDLEVYYDLDVLLEPGEEVEITYKVTTAEGVETPLRAITTPTLTEYR